MEQIIANLLCADNNLIKQVRFLRLIIQVYENAVVKSVIFLMEH